MAFGKNDEYRDKYKKEINEKVKAVKSASDAEVRATKAEAEVKQLRDQLEAYKKLNMRETEIKTLEIELESREKVLAANELVESKTRKKVKELEEQIEKADDRGYKRGYADGTADGIRKGLDVTADDRKMMAQIAAISAASHVPEATNMIAREVANGIAKDMQNGLPATAGTTDSKSK